MWWCNWCWDTCPTTSQNKKSVERCLEKRFNLITIKSSPEEIEEATTKIINDLVEIWIEPCVDCAWVKKYLENK